MTITHRKRQPQPPEEIQTVTEPGLQIECDSCRRDLTHSVRIKCADPICEPGDGVDICPSCFCSGREFSRHKRDHAYRVVELHSDPILTEDWGADEELLLLEGVSLQGLGNWQAIAEHIGTRTRDEIEDHYKSVYINSPNWPLPRMDLRFEVDASEFQERKRRRISNMNTAPAPTPKVAPTSAPAVHEIATFLPGRLEFEHELDNEAEDLVKDLEFGIVTQYGGDSIPFDDTAPPPPPNEKSDSAIPSSDSVFDSINRSQNVINGGINGHTALVNGTTSHQKSEPTIDKSADDDEDAEAEENMMPPPIETDDSIAFKLTLLDVYASRVEKRHENKAIMLERGLLEYKKMQAADKKRPKEEKDIVHRLRPFAKLQSAADYEVFCADIVYEATLRKRIQELQMYRRLGLRSAGDIEKYDADLAKRAHARATVARDWYTSERIQRNGSARQSSVTDPRGSEGPEPTPKPGGQTNAAPLNLANSPMLHLLRPDEQALCSSLRILPKPYLVIKETLVREYARRGGKLRRREARDLVKIDVNKTSRVWDFLVQTGFLKIAPDLTANANAQANVNSNNATNVGQPSG
ncbi:SWIRM-domain-containing protein [Thelephora ganbajun]|uniref:SWIRM-domain-containing protein n=1 Tax=Thelephora ganbajun TaxID=370292 RepID=A0ACB6ZPC1_THEGA|nr:SWIRM-domain-containing protein [Thelephora ganbajun]